LIKGIVWIKLKKKRFVQKDGLADRWYQYDSKSGLGNWFVLADIVANGDELNLILPKFARPHYFFFSSGFLALP